MNPKVIQEGAKVILVAVTTAIGVGVKRYGPKIIEILKRIKK